MENLKYVGKNLFIEKSSVASIAKKNMTPFYLYSENQIKENYIKFTRNYLDFLSKQLFNKITFT